MVRFKQGQGIQLNGRLSGKEDVIWMICHMVQFLHYAMGKTKTFFFSK